MHYLEIDTNYDYKIRVSKKCEWSSGNQEVGLFREVGNARKFAEQLACIEGIDIHDKISEKKKRK